MTKNGLPTLGWALWLQPGLCWDRELCWQKESVSIMSELVEAQAEIIFIIGRRGTGKTTLARKLVSERDPATVIAHDPMGQLGFERVVTALDEQIIPPPMPGDTLLLDEVDILATPNAYRQPWVRYMVHYGRHVDVDIIACARRPANVHKDIRALATKVSLGRLTEPGDIDYCVRSWGAVCARAADIPQFHFLEIPL
jgi:hypothetical protein